MRSVLCLALLCVALPGMLVSQENARDRGLEVMPGVTFVKLFPGAPLDAPGWEGSEWGGSDELVYSGTGLRFNARCFLPAYPGVAITIGGGVTWFYDSHTYRVVTSPSDAGVGAQLWRENFTVFPLSVGAQVVYPSQNKESLMLYAGAEGSLNFIDGRIMPGQQIKPGYTVLGGFVVKAIEFGIRYNAFSDLKNLGVHIGLRFPSFAL